MVVLLLGQVVVFLHQSGLDLEFRFERRFSVSNVRSNPLTLQGKRI